ncbi:hypothetical protein ACT2FY_38865 [Paraburkholderia fungorum]|uniref:hypothetical protein n=1 Tax=Paraburkholderia fungorum TaxID=134537 RepID=UPI00402B24F3
MTDAKEQKKPVLIRVPLPVEDWLFSEAVKVAEQLGGSVPSVPSVPSIIVAKLSESEGESLDDYAAVSKSKVEKSNVLVRLPMPLYDSLWSKALRLSDARRKRVTVPSLVVEKLNRLHRQAQEKQTVSP